MKTLLVLAAHPDFAETIRAGLSPEQYRIVHRADAREAEPLLQKVKVKPDFQQIADCLLGDYYPLTKCNTDKEAWIAWQFDEPERGEGVVQAFRRSECIYDSARLKLRGLDPKARYVLSRLDSRWRSEMTGAELLQNGIPVSISECPGAAVIKYQSVSSPNKQTKNMKPVSE